MFEEVVTTLTHQSIVLDSAATQFTPETPEVFCGLKHFPPTPPLRLHSGV